MLRMMMVMEMMKMFLTNRSPSGALIALLAVGCAGIGFGLHSIYLVDSEIEVLGLGHVPALGLVMQIESATTGAVEEAYAYVVSGDPAEKEESEEWFRRLDALGLEFGEQARLDHPGEAEEQAHFAESMALARVLEDRANEMFSEFERENAVSSETVDRFESVVNQCRESQMALIAIEKREVEASFAAFPGTLDRVKRYAAIGAASLGTVMLSALLFYRKRAESNAILLRSEARTSAIVESAAEGIITVDETGIILLSNPAVEKMFGFTGEELIGRNISILLPSPHAELHSEYLAAEIDRVEKKVVGKRIEVHGRARDGRVFPVQIAVSELKTDASQHFIALVRDLTEQKAAEEQIKALAYYDTLTGLPNRRLFWKRLAQALSSARLHGHKAALLFLDLDHFKRVNDSLGHWAGDALLKHVSARLTECIRPTDEVSRSEASSASLSRIGGDEFTILLPKLDDALDAAKVAGRLQSVLSEPFVWEGQEVSARVSTGIAVFPDDGEDTEVLVRNADTAMYHAKAEGRNNFQFYGEYMNVAAQRQLRIASDLRQAVGSEELTLHYQPVRDAIGGGLTAVEALLSWTRPGEDSVSPDEFIPIAEDMGLIIPLGDWVLHSACRQGQAWQNAGFPALRIAVNVSARQLQEPNWAERVARILAETGLSPAYLDLELTESAIMKNDETTLDNVTALSQMGVGLTLQDFGTGLSSISYLNRFPINRIKIDSSFVKQLVGGPEHAEALVVAILAMARCMDIEVVGEGVETEEQVDFLREHGCHELQGFLLSPPVPADELLGLLEEEKPGAGETTRP